MWQIDFNQTAQANLLRLDKTIGNRVLDFFTERVAIQPAPERIAEPLEGNFRGLHRFRVGNYRIVAQIGTILALFLDHRSIVYKGRLLPSVFSWDKEAGQDLRIKLEGRTK